MIFDQLGRTATQYLVILAFLNTIFAIAFMAYGVPLPAYIMPVKFSTLEKGLGIGPHDMVVAIMLMIAYSLGYLLYSFVVGYVAWFYAASSALAVAIGQPALSSIGIVVGGFIQMVSLWYFIALVLNYSAGSPWYSAVMNAIGSLFS